MHFLPIHKGQSPDMFWNGPGNGSANVRLSHHQIDGSKGDDSPAEKLLA